MRAFQVATVFLLVAVGIFIGLAISSATTLETTLKDWQTLVAGVLAIGAAGWTVDTMTRVDAAQQRRHENLMDINLRADRLEIDRATYTLPFRLRQSGHAAIAQLSDTMAAPSPNATKIRNLKRDLEALVKSLSSDAIVSARHLFDGETEGAREEAAIAVNRPINALEQLAMHYQKKIQIADVQVFQERRIVKAGLEALDHIEHFAGRLEQLRSQYGLPN